MPVPSDKPKMDIPAMQALSLRVDRMVVDGTWDEAAWNAALDEAAVYANGASGARDWLLSEALDHSWLPRRMERARTHVTRRSQGS